MSKLAVVACWLVAILGTTLPACGSASDTSDTPGWTFDALVDTDATGKDAPIPDTFGLPDGQAATCHLVFLAVPAGGLKLEVGTTEPLAAQVVALTDGAVASAPDVPVYFRILDGADQGDASLTALVSVSDPQGVAHSGFKAGTVPDVAYVVQAWADCAEPVSMTVQVTDHPRGALVVDVTTSPEFPLPLGEVELSVCPGDLACSQLSAVVPPVGCPYQQSVPTPEQDATFPDLLASETFTVFARAWTTAGQLAASGCLDAVTVLPDQSTTRVLELDLLRLRPTGCYEMTNVFDFTGAIPGEAGDLVDLLVEAVEEPGAFLIDAVIEVVKLYFGQIWASVAEAVLGPFKDLLTQLIEEWLATNAPPWLQCLREVGRDLIQVVANAELTGQLKLSKVGSDWTMQGEETWHGLNLYWTVGCAQGGACGGVATNPLEGLCAYDALKDKCRCSLGLDALADTEFPMDLVQGLFYARIAGFDRLMIDEHPLALHYGKLILFVLNELVLPYVTGGQYHSIEDVLAGIIDCAAIANGMTPDVLELVGLDQAQVKDFCQDGVTLLVGPIEEIIGSLSFSSKLWLSGGAKMIDTNDDLQVDELREGYWNGTVEVDGQPSAGTFEGTFEALRATCQ